MAENKKSFVLYSDSQGLINKLPDDVAGRLFKHIYAYVNDENPFSDELLVNIAFEPIKMQLKRDLIKWEQTLEGRSKAGKASAEAKRLTKEKEQNSTNSTNVGFVQQTSTNSTVNVNDNVNVNVNDIYNNKKEILLNLKNEVLKTASFEATQMILKINKDTHDIQLMFEDFIDHSISQNSQYKKAVDFSNHFGNHFVKKDLTKYLILSDQNKKVISYMYKNEIEELNLNDFLNFWNKQLNKEKESFSNTEIFLLTQTLKEIGKIQYQKIVFKIKTLSDDHWLKKDNKNLCTIENLSKPKNYMALIEMKKINK